MLNKIVKLFFLYIFIAIIVCAENKKKPTITPNLVNGVWSRIGKRNKDFDCNHIISINELTIRTLAKVIKCTKLRMTNPYKEKFKVMFFKYFLFKLYL